MPFPAHYQQYANALASYRVLFYSVFSIGAVAGVIHNALRHYSNFYSMSVYLSRSNGAIVVMANFGILLALLAGRLLQQVFFGPLRPTEVERLYDRMWFFVTESLLAFTIFRDEFDIPFALMFGFLLFIKCFHWLLSDRIEWMDQRPWPGPPITFHIRMQLLMSLLWIIDAVLFLYMIESMMSSGVGGSVLFASEYAILFASLGNSIAKYCISVIDTRRASARGGENAPPWEDKSMIIFYVEIVTDFVKLVTYMTFFMLVLTFYGLPLNIVRDVYVTARSFIIRFRDLLRYRSATRNMDERYPNATEADLHDTSDKTCIICRDEMVPPPARDATEGPSPAPAPAQGPNMTPKKLPCGHIFHFYCLRSWLERQQSCPTCRRSVLEDDSPQARANRRQGPQRAQPDAGIQVQAGAQNGANAQGNRRFGLLGAFGNLPQVNGRAQAPVQNLFGLPPDRRPERFAGFFGPDGVWHAWPQPEPQAPVPVPPQESEIVNIPLSPTTNPSASETRTGTATTAQPSEDHYPPGTPAESGQLTPREAARAAALRRFGPSTSPAGSTSSQPPTSASALPDQISASSNLQAPDQAPELPRSRHAEPTSANSATTRTLNVSTAPALIPLFDPHLASPSANTHMPLFQRATPPSNFFGYDPVFHAPPPSGGYDLRDLPPVMTDEQLRTMDRLTRDAIDARLRVLENVQNAAGRMTEELLRCRSVFPQVEELTEASGNTRAEQRSAEGVESSA